MYMYFNKFPYFVLSVLHIILSYKIDSRMQRLGGQLRVLVRYGIHMTMLFSLSQSHLQSMTDVNRDLVCNADVHFHPARTILSEIFRCLKLCDVFVAVVSKNYCNSKFCRYDINTPTCLRRQSFLFSLNMFQKIR